MLAGRCSRPPQGCRLRQACRSGRTGCRNERNAYAASSSLEAHRSSSRPADHPSQLLSPSHVPSSAVASRPGPGRGALATQVARGSMPPLSADQPQLSPSTRQTSHAVPGRVLTPPLAWVSLRVLGGRATASGQGNGLVAVVMVAPLSWVSVAGSLFRGRTGGEV